MALPSFQQVDDFLDALDGRCLWCCDRVPRACATDSATQRLCEPLQDCALLPGLRLRLRVIRIIHDPSDFGGASITDVDSRTRHQFFDLSFTPTTKRTPGFCLEHSGVLSRSVRCCPSNAATASGTRLACRPHTEGVVAASPQGQRQDRAASRDAHLGVQESDQVLPRKVVHSHADREHR